MLCSNSQWPSISFRGGPVDGGQDEGIVQRLVRRPSSAPLADFARVEKRASPTILGAITEPPRSRAEVSAAVSSRRSALTFPASVHRVQQEAVALVQNRRRRKHSQSRFHYGAPRPGRRSNYFLLVHVRRIVVSSRLAGAAPSGDHTNSNARDP